MIGHTPWGHANHSIDLPVTGRLCNTQTQQLSGVGKVEKCMQTTKEQLNDNLPLITTPTTNNITPTDKKTIKKLKQLQNKLTIKPAESFTEIYDVPGFLVHFGACADSVYQALSSPKRAWGRG